MKMFKSAVDYDTPSPLHRTNGHPSIMDVNFVLGTDWLGI